MASDIRLNNPVSDVDLRLLRVFKSVVACGGFSSAEVELGMSLAAISSAMSDLELRLGVTLCHRGRAGFSLTDEGQQVHESAQRLFSSLEVFRTEVGEIRSTLSGELNIGITDNLVTLEQMRVTNSLASLKRLGSDVRINIHMMPPSEIEKRVIDGRLHVGVVPEFKKIVGLNYHYLYDENSCLYCEESHPLFDRPDKELTLQIVLDSDAVAPVGRSYSNFSSILKKMRVAATATDREGAAFLILSGEYIGILPTHFASRWVETGRMRALLAEEISLQTPYTAITRKGGRASLILQTYMSELTATASQGS